MRFLIDCNVDSPDLYSVGCHFDSYTRLLVQLLADCESGRGGEETVTSEFFKSICFLKCLSKMMCILEPKIQKLERCEIHCCRILQGPS